MIFDANKAAAPVIITRDQIPVFFDVHIRAIHCNTHACFNVKNIIADKCALKYAFIVFCFHSILLFVFSFYLEARRPTIYRLCHTLGACWCYLVVFAVFLGLGLSLADFVRVKGEVQFLNVIYERTATGIKSRVIV